MFAFLIWLLCWVPASYCAWSVANRTAAPRHLKLVIVLLGAMLFAYAVCQVGIVVGLTPARVLTVNFAVGIVCAFLDWRTGRLQMPRWKWTMPTLQDLPVLAGGVVVALMLAWLLWLSILLPPHFADSTVTHSVAPAAWYADKAFSWPVAGFENKRFDTVNGYLRLPHFLFYFNTVVGGGQPAYMSLGQYHALLILLACCWALARQLGLGRGGAMIAVLATLAVTETQVQVVDCYLDVLVASSLAAVILSCVLITREPSLPRILGLAVTASYAMSIKVTGPFQVGLPWLGFTLYGLWKLRVTSTPPRLAYAFAASAGIVILLGGFWYLASWVRLGNPLHPFQISLMGRVLFSGITAYGGESFLLEPKGLNRLTALPMTWGERWKDYSLGSPYNGLGPLFVIAGLPAFFITAVSAVARRTWLYVVFAGVGCLVVASHPSAWQPRYSIVVATLGALALAQLFQLSGMWFRGFIGVLTLAGLFAATAHAIPYQVHGFYQPKVYWHAAITSPLRAHLSAHGLFPDTNPLHQRLLLDPEFAGKRILIAPHQEYGAFLRPVIDNRILQCDNLDLLPSFIEQEKPDYIYVSVHPQRRERGEANLAAVRNLGDRIEELPRLPYDQRLLSHYMIYASREHLFRVVNPTAQEGGAR